MKTHIKPNSKYLSHSIVLLLLVFALFFLSLCKKNDPPSLFPTDWFYLHLSHTRTDTNPKMDSIAELIDYNKYDMLWLGGDLAYSTSDVETMTHLDSILDFGSPNTLWTLGNHDYIDIDIVQEYTKRPTFYTYNLNGVTFLVLDTQDSVSSILGYQKELFDNVIDTIMKSTHLIVLHHKLIWMYGDSLLEPKIPLVSNVPLSDCSFCINPNNFYTDIYPGLVAVHEKGIEVICIGGDIGMITNEFEYVTPEGIFFLASGIKAGADDNKALLFHHENVNNLITWEYRLISELKKND